METWIFFDRARAYLMLHEVKEVQEFLRRSSTLQSDHALRRVREYLEDVENAGYADIQVVRGFREELHSTDAYSSSGGTPPEL